MLALTVEVVTGFKVELGIVLKRVLEVVVLLDELETVELLPKVVVELPSKLEGLAGIVVLVVSFDGLIKWVITVEEVVLELELITGFGFTFTGAFSSEGRSIPIGPIGPEAGLLQPVVIKKITRKIGDHFSIRSSSEKLPNGYTSILCPALTRRNDKTNN